jgi:hypothetical protein
MKTLVTLKYLHSRLLAVNTLSLTWSWGSPILQNDLVLWSKSLQHLTLRVRFDQRVELEVTKLCDSFNFRTYLII